MLDLNLYSNWINDKEIIKYPLNILEKCELSSEVVKFLSEIGVPCKIEPSIWFLSPEKGGLKKLVDYYIEISNPEKQKFINAKNEVLNKLYVIAKSSGSAICFNEDKQLVWIDYDDFNKMFVNSSFEEFIECTLCFNKLVDEINQRKFGRMKYYNYITKDEIVNLRDQLNSICNNKLNKSDFWNSKIEFLEERI